jgi:hypothetical protein
VAEVDDRPGHARGAPEDGEDEESGDEEDEDVGGGHRLHVQLRHRSARIPLVPSPARLMSTHASVLIDSVGPPSAKVCRTAASFP